MEISQSPRSAKVIIKLALAYPPPNWDLTQQRPPRRVLPSEGLTTRDLDGVFCQKILVKLVTSEALNFRTSEHLNFRNFDLRNFRYSELSKLGGSKLPTLRCSEVSMFVSLDASNFRTSELHRF